MANRAKDYIDEFDTLNVTSMNVLDMCKTPLLSLEEEQGLFTRLAQIRGEIKDLERLNGQSTDKDVARLEKLKCERESLKNWAIEANGRLVVSITRKYLGRGVELADLNQEGVAALRKAVDKFDIAKKHKFSTYATWWVRQAVTRAIADQGRTIRLPVHMGDQVRKLYEVSMTLQQEIGRPVTDKELAEELNTTEEKIRQLFQYSKHIKSLEEEILENRDDGDDLHHFIEDDEAVAPEEAATQSLCAEAVNNALETLDPREARILRLRYGMQNGKTHTLEEVGQKLGITRERVRQIEAGALKKLRHPRRARRLREFLEV